MNGKRREQKGRGGNKRVYESREGEVVIHVVQSENKKRYFIWDERKRWIKNNKNQMAFLSVLF